MSLYFRKFLDGGDHSLQTLGPGHRSIRGDLPGIQGSVWVSKEVLSPALRPGLGRCKDPTYVQTHSEGFQQEIFINWFLGKRILGPTELT